MVDVSGKTPQRRTAKASGRIRLAPATLTLVAGNALKKGDVFTVAELAGIQAAKRTHELVPLCHPLSITNIDVTASLEEDAVAVSSTVTCVGPTGVEMEALTAVSVALLAVYDMCKAVDHGMVIEQVTLTEKTKQDIE
ncbi:MAG: cyclic pyranopterin monophosphate synthase MoaC [Nitrospiraceae bacterium]|nr:cyclic pyranopterin monophosphate synthase MoaC [Nitrospiraceae bacterium]